MQIYSLKKSFRFFRIIAPAYLKSLYRPIPLWVHLYVTRKCNLNCEYCFVRDSQKKDLKEEELKKIIDKIYSLGCRIISFFGGEPTIRQDFINLVNYAHKKGVITHVSTNGIMLTPEYIEALAKEGIDVINLSVDSVIKSSGSQKNYIKSKKILEDLIKARKKYGFEININLVLTNQNANTAIETIELMNSLKIPISIGLIIENTYSDEKQKEDFFFKTSEEKNNLFRILEKIRKLKKKGYNIIEPLQYFNDIKKFFDGKLDWYCSAGKYYFSVDSDGKFQLCAGLPAENMTIFDIDKNYFKKLSGLRKGRLSKCKKICLSNCLYNTSYFIKHPLYFIKELF